MAPPRKSVSHGNGDLENDPERANKTGHRAARPPPRLLPSKRGRKKDEAPETPTPSEVESETPSPHKARAEAFAGSQLEGEGLDALDPEIGSQTMNLKVEALGGGGKPGGEDGEDGDRGEAVDDTTGVGPSTTLEIIDGPDAGRKRVFRGARMVIGRIPGVNLLLKDQSVSRRHIELVQDDGGVLLRDLGSGNGTTVNGAPVTEKKLEHGDEIRIGQTTIRFVDEVAFRKAREEAERKEAEEKAKAEADEKAKAAQAAADQAAKGETPAKESPKATVPSAGRRMRLAAVGLGVAVVLAIGVAGGVHLRRQSQVEAAQAAAEQKMQDARAAASAADYETAVRLVEDAEKLVPGIDESKLGSQAREELALRRVIDEAKAHIAAHRFEDAKRVLDKAPAGSNEGEEVKAHLRKDLDRAEIAYKKEQLGELLAGGDLEAAKGVLGELPASQKADSARKIADFERQLKTQKKVEVRYKAQQGASAASRRQAEREEEMLAALTTVERKFAGGEWERAASECTRVIEQAGDDEELKARARMLETAMPSFGRAYDEGMKKYRQGALGQAAKPLRAASELFGRMQLRRNKYQSELESKLGEASLVAGREALVRDDLPTAFQAFRDAAKLDPSDPKAQAGLSNVEAKAEDLFQLADRLRASDPAGALRRFRIVAQSTDPSWLVHEKALIHIAVMAP